MKKLNYFSIILFFLIFLLDSCSFKKDSDKETKNIGTNYIETVAKPDLSLKGITFHYFGRVLLEKVKAKKTHIVTTGYR